MARSGRRIVPSSENVDAYIAKCPAEVQIKLRQVRRAILAAAPGALETTSYFELPGYSYPGFDYGGMFVWFSYRAPDIGLHLRPPTLELHAAELTGYRRTRAILRLPEDRAVPLALVRRLVKTSLRIMRET